MRAETLTQKWAKHTLTEREIVAYIAMQLNPCLPPSAIADVAHLCHTIYLWSTRQIDYLDSFSAAVVANKLDQAVFAADEANRLAMWLYPMFLHNVAPGGWRDREVRP
jgi:hypothetical protein